MLVFDVPRMLVAIALAACVFAVLPAVSSAHANRRKDVSCANTTLQPAIGNLPLIRAAVLCLHNRERAARGLPALRENTRLRKAAKAHSDDMVARRYFAHDTLGGPDMATRILRTGYARGQGWSLGENIAWGTGSLGNAAQIARAWMNSSGHRANILRREFREIGIGIAVGVPVAGGGPSGATYTADFGVRR
jgi:uncharacterized protein YkwD